MATEYKSANFFQNIYNIVEQTIDTFANVAGSVISIITPLMATCFGIYIMLLILSWWRNPPENHVSEWITRMVAWAAVLGIGMNISVYSGSIAPFINGFADDIAMAFGSNEPSSQIIQVMYDDYIKLILKVWDDIGWLDVSGTCYAVFASVVILLSAIPLLCIAMAYMLLAKIALGILIAIGPIFIAMALFPATRQFFTSWTAQCTNYGLLIVIFSVAVKFVMSVNQTVLNIKGYGAVASVSTLFEIGALNGLFIFVFMNLPSLASGLAGGVTVGGMLNRGQAAKAAVGVGKEAGTVAAKVSGFFKRNKIGA